MHKFEIFYPSAAQKRGISQSDEIIFLKFCKGGLVG